jgi:hypothetical protein
MFINNHLQNDAIKNVMFINNLEGRWVGSDYTDAAPLNSSVLHISHAIYPRYEHRNVVPFS